MKTVLTTFILLLVATAYSQTAKNKQPLIVEAPAKWIVKYEGGDSQIYSVTREEEIGFTFLSLTHWSATEGKNDIPKLVDSLAKGFLAEGQKAKLIKLETTEYKTEKFEGDGYSGQFALFALKDGLAHAHFAISAGNGIWNGQFTGPRERWPEALGILKNIKTNN